MLSKQYSGQGSGKCVRQRKVFGRERCPAEKDVRQRKVSGRERCPAEKGVRQRKVSGRERCPAEKGVRLRKVSGRERCPAEKGVRQRNVSGFWHEQARSDRDNFVKINFENILDGKADQFTKLDWRDSDNLGTDYDYQSIMHYSRTAFSKNSKPTIEAINNPSMKFGNPQHRLSTKDIIEINALYDCRTTRYGWTAWSEYTPCDKRCKKSRERYCYHNGNIKMCGGNVNTYGIEKQVIDCLRCPDRDDTDFEGGIGVWFNTKGDDFDWTLHKRFTKTMLTGPMKDHTSGKGYYLYIESSIPRRPGDKARFVTTWLPFVRGGQCIKFAYSMYGRTTGRLSLMVEMKDRNVKYYIFLKNGNQGEGWKSGMGNIDLPPSVQYRLTFEAVIGSGTGYSDIAIDDVYIDPGLCNCQDDYASCKRWASKGGCNNETNNYSAINNPGTNNRSNMNLCTFKSDTDFERPYKKCTHRGGTEFFYCEAVHVSFNILVQNHVEPFTFHNILIHFSPSFVNHVVAKYSFYDRDDTDFEGGIGVWFNTKGDDFDWSMRKGFTQTMLTGPMKDHTSGKGYYLYIESSIPRRPGDKARFVTTWLPSVRGGQCIKFAYSMYGRTTGRLSLMVEMKNRNVKYYIFYKKGNQGEGWKSGMGNIDLPLSVQYRLTFEAVIGSGTGYSDIAIDDVYIDPGLCNCQDDYASCKRWASKGGCNNETNNYSAINNPGTNNGR
ncbi:hypothetical protein QZH41_007993 [Actinostola sp. cb2023]|nr:hypothetical protein QZH41_007993 [Actinostola sp. cb2023]